MFGKRKSGEKSKKVKSLRVAPQRVGQSALLSSVRSLSQSPLPLKPAAGCEGLVCEARGLLGSVVQVLGLVLEGPGF